MPFCTQCGQPVTATVRFCAACGAAQPAQTTSFWDRFDARTTSILCYVPLLGWLVCILVLSSPRFRHDRDTRFHATQGLYLFVAWLILDWGLEPFLTALPLPSFYTGVYNALKALLVVAAVVMMIKTSQREHYRLPILGELAEKSVAEQR